MSQTTRINRPTYTTPRKNPPGRFIHVSTHYRWIRPLIGSVVEGSTPMFGEPQFRKMARGSTYRRQA